MSFRYAAGINKPGYNGLLAPDSPTIGTATGSNTSASVAFTAPSNVGGGAITGYIVVSSPGGITATGTSSPISVTGLTNDTAYTFTVSAGNAYGYSLPSSASNSVTPTLSLALYAWGGNGQGQLGLNNVTSYSSPKQIGSLTNWLLGFAANYFTLAITKAGSMWSWGRDNNGQLGLGNITNYISPKQIGSLTTWASLGGSKQQPYSNTSFAIKTDGTLWAWGRNEFGQLGLGDTTYRSSPVQVGSLTNWLQVVSGYAQSLAIKTDGTLWSLGGVGNNGTSGLGNTTRYSSPKQVGSLTDWATLAIGKAQVVAVKTDGTLWAWGQNNNGQLGDGTTVTKSSPVQVGLLTNWSKVSAGQNCSFGIKTDGTLWAWGGNSLGQLGLGNRTDYSSPKQVGSLTSWSKVSGGDRGIGAIRTNGTLWTWGYNNSGVLGLGNNTYYSSPKQVGSLTNWYDISMGYQHAIATVTV